MYSVLSALTWRPMPAEKKFDALQEISETLTPNDKYEYFINAHLEAAAEYIPTKQRAKPRVPSTLADRKKRAYAKIASKYNRRNPTNINALKLKQVQNKFANIYVKEQIEYRQNQNNKIRDSVEDRQSRIAWQTANDVSRKKSTVKDKLNATSQEERIQLWKQHFDNLFGKPPKVTHEPITKFISNQVDIKLRQFTQEERLSTKKN